MNAMFSMLTNFAVAILSSRTFSTVIKRADGSFAFNVI